MGLQRWVRRSLVLATLLTSFILLAWYLPRALNPTETSPSKQLEDRLWVETSPYFWDRAACRWLGLCGVHHLRADPAVRVEDGGVEEEEEEEEEEWLELRRRGVGEGDGKGKKKRRRTVKRRIVEDVPDYVLRFAPYVHLYSGEQFWPSDIAEHVRHMNATDHHGNPLHHGLENINLDRLNLLDAGAYHSRRHPHP
ncbi:hypothetical protein CDD80_4309 [Ophiocordyceps camponoti-rufipedis]|uniref:Uncharacterized protein n=1 Tax=Ophiocordyceps camponoti-rufipedis TaxID=2004952 RepID=A0A2C5YVA8_9HYPO|nr:hypothetical protein CDD80_4309 [Ophiocordyceps camponoti-rufipedis]